MSDFFVRKMRTFFKRLDFDGDGKVTQKDFEDIADRFMEKKALDEVRGNELKAKLIQAWEKYLRDPNSGTPLDEDGFVNVLKVKVSDPAFREMVIDFNTIYFTGVDFNADGYIQSNEYEVFFEIFGFDKALAPASFAAIDTNNDGQLSLEEFVIAGTDFFYNEDESCPSKLFWGPLV